MPIAKKLKIILKFASKGMPILPVVPHGKKPMVPGGVYAATTDKTELKQYFQRHPDANYGVATGQVSGILVVDVDGETGRNTLSGLKAKYGELPKTVTVRTDNGRHYYFRSGGVAVRNSAGRLGEGLDFRGDGGYVVGPGSVHASGVKYQFVDGRALGEVDFAKAPKWLLDAAKAPGDKAEADIECTQPLPLAKVERASAYAGAALRRELDRLAKAPKHQRNNTLNICAFKLGQLLPYGILSKGAVTDDLLRVALRIDLDDSEIRPTIASGLAAGQQFPRRLPFLKADRQVATADLPGTASGELTKDLSKLGETDTDNAQRFAARFGHTVIYTPGRGWLVFDGRRWRPDDTHRCTELAKETARLIAEEPQYLDSDQGRASRAKFAQASLSKGALDRMIDLAESLVCAEDKSLDADLWFLNTETGTIDLRTGRRQKHDPRDLLTKIAPVAANRRAKCPTFKKFLKRIMRHDAELTSYVQKVIGYSLTGQIGEQAFFFCYGKSGRNGKSTLVNLIRDMLGDYGCHTPTETLMVKQYDNAIPNDLARLVGARMVTAVEANFNRPLDEARLKAMTGGEKIAARFMRQEYFEFLPAFKLWLVANDRPRVRGTDPALWRRVRVIPFEVEIPESECDRDLPTKLKAEWPGILAWAVRGCLKWQADGLAEPAAVRKATRRWYRAADHLNRFVGEMLISAPGHAVPASTLFDLYVHWCKRNGEEPLSIRQFKERLCEFRDMTHKESKRGSDWIGVKIR